MLVIIGSARAVAGRHDELVSAAREVAAATRGDDGCLSYGFYADLDDPSTVVGVETWRDQDALDAHMAHTHTQRFLGRVGGLLDGTPSMTVHRVVDAG